MNSMARNVQRGDIYYANLNPVVGSEEGGERPVLILSNNVGNRYGTTIIVAPITSRKRRKQYSTHLKIKSFAGLKKDSTILFEQIRVIDKKRLLGYIGTLDRRFLLQAERAIRISIDLRS